MFIIYVLVDMFYVWLKKHNNCSTYIANNNILFKHHIFRKNWQYNFLSNMELFNKTYVLTFIANSTKIHFYKMEFKVKI